MIAGEKTAGGKCGGSGKKRGSVPCRCAMTAESRPSQAASERTALGGSSSASGSLGDGCGCCNRPRPPGPRGEGEGAKDRETLAADSVGLRKEPPAPAAKLSGARACGTVPSSPGAATEGRLRTPPSLAPRGGPRAGSGVLGAAGHIFGDSFTVPDPVRLTSSLLDG